MNSPPLSNFMSGTNSIGRKCQKGHISLIQWCPAPSFRVALEKFGLCQNCIYIQYNTMPSWHVLQNVLQRSNFWAVGSYEEFCCFSILQHFYTENELTGHGSGHQWIPFEVLSEIIHLNEQVQAYSHTGTHTGTHIMHTYTQTYTHKYTYVHTYKLTMLH